MTTNIPGDHDIDTLADRAREMLERVRSAADPEALTPRPTPLPIAEADEPTVDEVTVEDEPTVDEVTVVDEPTVNEVTVEDDPVVDELTFDEELLDEAPVTDEIDVESDSGSRSRLDQLNQEAKQQLGSASQTDELIEEVSIEDSDQDADDRLNLFGRKDEREVDEFEYSFGSNRDALEVDDSWADETIDSSGFDVDSEIASDAEALDADELIREIEGLSGDEDPVSNVVGLDLDIDSPAEGDAFEDLEVIEDDEVFADDIQDGELNTEIRNRGRLSDLGTDDPAPQPQPQQESKSRFGRRPHVDHDLNELFLKPGSPDQAVTERSSSWLVPILCMAIAILAFAWWAAGRGGDDDASSSNVTNGEVQTDTTTDDANAGVTNTVDTSSAETSPTTVVATTAAVEEAPETFSSAWELLGEASSTDDFASFGAPIGLQQALEQAVDANGDPMNFTLLAPSNDAMAKLTVEQLDALANDAQGAQALVNYHFIDQPLTPEFLLQDSGGQIMTRAGVPILVDYVDDEIVFNGEARIELAGLEAENGSILVIDTVLSPPSINTIVDLGNIQFKPIQSVLTEEGKTELQKAVTYFNENPDARAIIEGHTDTDGEESANLNLSQRRADAVRTFLIEQGIDAGRLEAKGFGETQPILIGGAEDKDASRRIEFILQ